jgi:SAM-dependent methyltransferase
MIERRARLFVASFLLLYFELVLIRWVPGHVRVLAYFTNFVLIGSFFGMGLGLMLSRSKRDLSPLLVAGIALLVGLTFAFKDLWVAGDSGVAIFLEYEGSARAPLALGPVLLAFYASIAVAFVPFGQVIGRAFQGAALTDYSLNLLGSLAGIVVFSCCSQLVLPPWCWFTIGLLPLCLLVPKRIQFLAGTAVVSIAIVFAVWNLDRGTIWSPYYKLQITPAGFDPKTLGLYPFDENQTAQPLPFSVAFNLRVNDDFYQLPVDLSDASIARYPQLRAWRARSFTVCDLHEHLDRVLIVGGGTGNDAAAAVRCGAKQVDVVDIDPEIVRLGRAMHPEHPYSNSKVRVTIDDARHFFQHAVPGYDAIVFALLDSHTLMSSHSSLRLDSYVFTVESFEQARHLLSPRGVQITAFALRDDWERARFYEMLRSAYGEEPIVASAFMPTVGEVFVSGPGAAAATGFAVRSRKVDPSVVLATDDWPFIYLRGRSIPEQYLYALTMILLVSFFAVRWSAGRSALPDLHFFCLGAAFLLLETHNVTAIALAFGSTWYVNSVVFASILVMALISNVLMAKVDALETLPVGVLYAGLFAALFLNWSLPVEALTATAFPLRLLTVGGATALPILFSGMIFARSFKYAANPAHALGSNVFGSIVGGAIEYLSLITGLKLILVVIAAFYAASAIRVRGVSTNASTYSNATATSRSR